MRTFYRFVLPSTNTAISLPAFILNCLERLLLLGEFVDEDDVPISPIAVECRIGGENKRIPLFAAPLNHLWIRPGDVTTKNTLKELRQTREGVDSSYDIDVLRMTEPRIVYIYDTLAIYNQLDEGERSKCFLHAEEAWDTNASEQLGPVCAAFRNFITCLLSDVFLVTSNGILRPKRFRFKTNSGAGQLYLSIENSDVHDLLLPKVLASFAQIIHFEWNETRIDAFELKSYDHWVEPSEGEPFEILGVLSRDCNAKCDFCYVLGNPSNTAIKLQKYSNSGSAIEARTRLSYFQKGLKLPLPTYDTEEITTHPHFFDLCEAIRKTSDRCISITTNGYRLSDEALIRLKALAPVDISLSLNAAGDATRAWLMGGMHRRGIQALESLDRQNMPCAVTIVAWPRVPIEEIKDTVRYASKFNVRSISVLLGGYTRLFPSPPEYPIPGYWNNVIDSISPLREEIDVPLILQPRLYEEQYRFRDALGRNLVTGVNRYSAAKTAGIKVYDEIVKINGSPTATRNECLAILSLASQEKQKLQITIARGDDTFDVLLDPRERQDSYIYDLGFTDRFGLHLIGESIPIVAIRQIFELVAQHRAAKVLLLTSMIVLPFVKDTLRKLSFMTNHDVEFDLQIPRNRFLGGNIVMGDMLVVDDFVDFLHEYLRDESPDLILVPSGPFNHGGWLRDMKGQPFELLKRSFVVPIELIQCPYFE